MNEAYLSYLSRLDSFRDLQPNWDSYGGVPGDPQVLEVARVFLQAVLEGKLSLVPLGDGGVQLELHWQGFDVELEINPQPEGEPFGQLDGVWDRRSE